MRRARRCWASLRRGWAHCQGPSPSSPPREPPPPPCARWTAPPLMTPLSRWHPSPSGRSLWPKGGYGGEATTMAVHLKDSEKKVAYVRATADAHASTHRQPGSRTGPPRKSPACTSSERCGRVSLASNTIWQVKTRNDTSESTVAEKHTRPDPNRTRNHKRQALVSRPAAANKETKRARRR